MTSNGRWPLMEEDHKISKIEYLSNQRSDLPQILNLSSRDQIKIKNAWHEETSNRRQPNKYLKLNISATTNWIFHIFQSMWLVGILLENSGVALLYKYFGPIFFCINIIIKVCIKFELACKLIEKFIQYVITIVCVVYCMSFSNKIIMATIIYVTWY